MKPSLSFAGPIMIGLNGLALTDKEITYLKNPQVGSVLLFKRNLDNPDQVKYLIDDIKTLRSDLKVAVDQEGGRVQRLSTQLGFEPLKSFRDHGHLYNISPHLAYESLRELADEITKALTFFGFDLSFAPVLDLDYGYREHVIGDRALHCDLNIVIACAEVFIDALHEAGYPAIGKHFPGHGAVLEDSHLTLPRDERDASAIKKDSLPFEKLASKLDGIMMAHVLYPTCDPNLPCLSKYWIQTRLRKELDYQGLIFSDELSMAALRAFGDDANLCKQSMKAGCDVIIASDSSKICYDSLLS